MAGIGNLGGISRRCCDTPQARKNPRSVCVLTDTGGAACLSWRHEQRHRATPRGAPTTPPSNGYHHPINSCKTCSTYDVRTEAEGIMLGKLTNTFFWGHQFDQDYRIMTYGLHFPGPGNISEEKRLYWRTVGKQRGLSPAMAAYTAFNASVVEIVKSDHTTSVYKDCIIDLVKSLALSIPPEHPDYMNKCSGDYVLDEILRPFFEEGQYRENEKRTRICEVDSFLLSEEDFTEAEQALRAGRLPNDVVNIYESIVVGRTAHDVRVRTGLDLNTVLFWLNTLLRMNVITCRRHMFGEPIFWAQKFLVENTSGEPHETFQRFHPYSD